MSVKKEESGRRSIQVEVEVPGTPEEVWEAIATGPGVSSWFFPTRIEEREGGSIACNMGPGMEAVGTVTSWDPPRRFTAEGPGPSPEAPPLATEWTVEARSGGRCVVRVVHSLFADNDDWDDQLEGAESGWPRFFGILRLYLTHFRGRSCSSFSVMGSAALPESEAWDALTGSLRLAEASPGQRWSAPASGVPQLAGVVEGIGRDDRLDGLLRLEDPTPGIASLGAFAMGNQACLSISFYLYGDQAPAAAARDEPLWRTWMSEQFPAAAG